MSFYCRAVPKQLPWAFLCRDGGFQEKNREKMFQFLKKKGEKKNLKCLGSRDLFFSRSRLPSCITRVTFGLNRANFGGHFSLAIAKVLLMFCCDV